MTPAGREGGEVAAAFCDREFPFSRRDFRKIADIVHTEVGIRLAETKAPLVYARLVRRLRTLQMESFARYCSLVESFDGTEERRQMLGAITTNVTRFFREPHHFAHLKTRLLPSVADAVRAGARLRIWSAGCSSGEEPYSIALAVLEAMPDAAQLDVRILATDVNEEVLACGKAGVYSLPALGAVNRAQRARWFTCTRGADGRRTLQAGEEMKALVAFRRLNLLSQWPMSAAYQAIFCRNVLMYFDEEDQAAIQRRMVGLLAPGGCLYLGAAEHVRGLEILRPDGLTTYRLQGRPPTCGEGQGAG